MDEKINKMQFITKIQHLNSTALKDNVQFKAFQSLQSCLNNLFNNAKGHYYYRLKNV